ncbi:MAG TPA: ABC transporter ATP-binding protein [Candidatus Cloacimonadota bacterium]|nr:ABC transporter ATP-binding protein [Candidatus Cloacimonadota bacterium]
MPTSVFKEKEYSKRFDMSLWGKVFRQTWVYKKDMLFLAFVMGMVAAVDALFPQMTRRAIDQFVTPHSFKGLLPYTLEYIGLILVQVVNIWFLIAVAGKVETSINYLLRKKGYEKLQALSFSYYDVTPVGWIISRMTSDIARLGDLIAWGIVDFAWGVFMMIFLLIFMFVMNWKLALLVLTMVPLLVLVSSKFQISILKSYREVRKTNSQITSAFNEGIMGAKTTKTLVREDANLGEFETLTHRMYHSSVRAAVLSSLYFPIVLLIGTLGSGLVLWVGGYKVMSQVISYGTLVAFMAYASQFFEPISNMARIFAEMQSAQAAAERVFSMMETEPDIVDGPDVITDADILSQPVKGEIEFKNVHFSYVEGEKVLEDFNLHLKPGQKIALVGETGSGKSTIVNLICRFYQPKEGQILIDGTDYTKYPLKWLQSKLGYVLQNPHLFSGTVRENIRYGRLDATDLEVEQAARLVNAHEFIMEFENGYDHQVGEGGNLLSTGQKQLISFARALLANPALFILDEATSSVDTETELLIQKAIDKTLEGRTSFIIAHRLSTIRSADRILVIENGRIIEDGNHQTLIHQRGHYYRLYTNQFLEEKELEILAS